ncbi:helix-turn-helix domain-containing protein [Robiginitalea sediminis]|uniref:helix-turn-helix domain-containing protein n=1 Tax=Robiginitalea sediminis TaxID=1982593 RepID=UPI0013030F33|nr:helix-turn-helix domain-containing protein [Robiginitalea sediminis]
MEHRNTFNLDFCELNVFETHKQARDFHLKFPGFTVTSMLRGKKVMRIEGLGSFDYLPGETVLASRDQLMRIDFPEANRERPTQCTALVIDDAYVKQQLNRIREQSQLGHKAEECFTLDLENPILKNNQRLALVSGRMIQVLSSKDPFKHFEAELILKELLLCLIRMQNLGEAERNSVFASNSKPIHAIIAYINSHLTSEIRIETLCQLAGMSKSALYRMFTEQFGISPARLVLQRRLEHAKELIRNNPALKIKEVAYASGFNDPNYFNRAFKKLEGQTPQEYRVD